MGTTGSVTIDLNNIRDTTNAGLQLGERVVEGVADQGSLIGLAIGLSIAIGLIVLLIVLVIGIPSKLIRQVKGIKKA